MTPGPWVVYRRESGAILHRTPDCPMLRRSKDVVQLTLNEPPLSTMACRICCPIRGYTIPFTPKPGDRLVPR